MRSKELRWLSRQDLLELLVRQQRKNEKLTARLTELEDQLQDRTIQISNTGSMAEAALALNEVFADADRAVEQYMENIRRCSEEQTDAYDRIVLAAEQRAEEIIRAAEEEKSKRMKEADLYCQKRINELKKLLRAYPQLKEQPARSGSGK